MDQLNFSLPAPAKINLFLNITARRADGYHELQTVFQLLDYCDQLHFSAASADVNITCPALDLPVEDNLVFQAAQALREATGVDRGATIRIDKCIPQGAGLGGGSSNAATALVGLNRLWNLGLGTADLKALGLSLGADVPVFVEGRSAWAEGVGEILQPIDLPEKWYLVLNPGCEVPTARIFADPHLTRSNSPITIAHFLRQGSENVCEPVVRRLYPPVDAALRWLGKRGPAKMTGTGSCVFLPFESESAASELLSQVPDPWTAFIARGVERSPLLEALDDMEEFLG